MHEPRANQDGYQSDQVRAVRALQLGRLVTVRCPIAVLSDHRISTEKVDAMKVLPPSLPLLALLGFLGLVTGCSSGEEDQSAVGGAISAAPGNSEIVELTNAGAAQEVTGVRKFKVTFPRRGAVGFSFYGDRDPVTLTLNGRTYEVGSHGGEDGSFTFVNEYDQVTTQLLKVDARGKKASFSVRIRSWADKWSEGSTSIFPAGMPCSTTGIAEYTGYTDYYRSGKWLSLQTGQAVTAYGDSCVPRFVTR